MCIFYALFFIFTPMDQNTIHTTIAEFFAEKADRLIPQLSIDCVIFSFAESQLKVLLLQFLNLDLYVLPSGFIFQDEDIDAAALRNLKERTSLDQIFLQQFHAFGKATRYIPDQMRHKLTEVGIDRDKIDWFTKRFVTIGYYALVDYYSVEPQVGLLTEKWIWADINDLPALAMDHQEMIIKAKATLKKDLHTQPLGLQLLPDTFTLPELQRLYEIILDRPIDRRNFRKKMLQSNILHALDEQRPNQGRRAPNLYRFDKAKYEESLSEEVKMGF